MQVVIVGDENIKNELLASSLLADVDLIWVTEISTLKTFAHAAAFIDLQFVKNQERVKLLQALLPQPVIVNSVDATLAELDTSFIRINAWPTFLKPFVVEASGTNEKAKLAAAEVFSCLHKQLKWLPDELGFVTPRIISTIINEAYFALSEGVSTKEEIDTAMKLGTNYPYGPFEWSQKIGLQKIAHLLNKLSLEQERYKPCNKLLQEAGLI